MTVRPAIPAEVKRELLLECGHRCACDGTPIPLELAHIIPWRYSKEHRVEDLICLCATCHALADRDHWGEKTLREYKETPWILRNFGKAISPRKTTSQIELTIAIELDDFDEKNQRWLQYAVAAFLKISPHDVRITSIEETNSAKVTIEVPTKGGEEILSAYEQNDPELFNYFSPLAIISLRKVTVREHPVFQFSKYGWPVRVHGVLARVTVLFLSSLLLIFLFSVRPVRPNGELMKYNDSLNTAAAPKPLEGDFQELLKIELQKTNDEIKMRIEQADTWFHYKFLLVGGLLALFLGYLGFGNSDDGTNLTKRLDETLRSQAAPSILALACIVALAIDIHIRNNITVIQQLALWITYYAEPAFLHASFDPSNTGQFLPWEQFLRVDVPGKGMHRDDLYGFAFYPHLHFMTWVMYMLHLWSFQRLSIAYSRGDSELAQQRVFAIGGFALVHLSLGAFTWIAHYVPGAFEVKLNPFNEQSWVAGATSARVHLVPWALLVLLNIPYLVLLARRSARQSHETS